MKMVIEYVLVGTSYTVTSDNGRGGKALEQLPKKTVEVFKKHGCGTW